MSVHPLLAPLARAWLKRREWGWQEDEDAEGLVLEVTSGPSDGMWRWYLQVREEQRQLALFTILDRQVPADRFAEMAAFVIDASFGLTVGGFELNSEEGQLRFRTSIGLGDAELAEEEVVSLLDEMARTNGLMVAGYGPAVAAVLEGRATGGDAVREVEGR